VLCGFDAAGIDLDRKDVDAYLQFFTTWLKAKRAKHASRRHGPATTISFAAGKGAERQEVVAIAADTTTAVQHLGGSSVDVVVVDLPYGVQHGSTAGEALRRGPADLLASALPVWRKVLRGGGAMALSWNTKVLARDQMLDALDAAGFHLIAGGAVGRFAHRVDQAVDRDVVLARR